MLHFLFVFWINLIHPLYITVTEINHNIKTKELEITCRIYIEDLEQALKNKVNIAKPADRKTADNMIGNYLLTHLSISVSGKPANMKFLNYGVEDGVAICFIEAKGINAFKKLSIRNTLLYKEHDTETNIVHINCLGERKSFKLEYPESSVSAEF